MPEDRRQSWEFSLGLVENGVCKGVAFLRRLEAGGGYLLCRSAEISIDLGALCLLRAGDG